MRKPAASTVLRYLRELAGLMGLADWDIAVGPDPDPRVSVWTGEQYEPLATVEVHREKSYALIEVADALYRESATEQRQALCHELVHIHLAPMDWSVQDLLGHVGVRAKRVAEATWEQRSERACDDLARLLAPSLPLPPWKTPTGR